MPGGFNDSLLVTKEEMNASRTIMYAGLPVKLPKLQRNFLRKGSGRGGSSTKFDVAQLEESHGSYEKMVGTSYRNFSPAKGTLVPMKLQ